MNEQFREAWRVLPDYLTQHVILSASALGLATLIGLPLTVLAARSARVRWPALAFASVLQTVPGLALMALFYPALLAVSALTTRAFGFATPALGFLPALLALTLYGLLPILRNGVAALSSIDPAILEAAKGVGMTPSQQLFRVEAPLAAPVFMAGLRTSAVWTIGAATLATPVGQTSLGNYIFSGLQTENWVFVAFGCIASAGLALVADFLLAVMERGATRRSLLLFACGGGALVAGVAAAFVGAQGAGSSAYVIGAKNFSEQYILADLMAERVRASGASVRLSEGLGSAVAFRALASGDIDAYVDYSGTLWTNVMRRTDRPTRRAMIAQITDFMKKRYGVRVLGALGFQNAYALTMQKARARALGVRTIGDLAPLAPRLTLGADLEFLERPEWRSVQAAYHLHFQAMRSYNPTFMYRALASGEADVISAFSSDGRIAADHLVTLSDPLRALPNYDALVLLSPRRAHDQRLIDSLRPLIGAIDVCAMRAANYMVDRTKEKLSPAQAAHALARRIKRRAPARGRAADGEGCATSAATAPAAGSSAPPRSSGFAKAGSKRSSTSVDRRERSPLSVRR